MASLITFHCPNEDCQKEHEARVSYTPGRPGTWEDPPEDAEWEIEIHPSTCECGEDLTTGDVSDTIVELFEREVADSYEPPEPDYPDPDDYPEVDCWN